MSVIARRPAIGFLAALAALTVCSNVLAQPLPAGRRVALNGYDPVSYFTAGHPEKGSNAFWFAYDDAIYFFKSAEHRAMFAAEPDRYAPQYAGFCAAALSKGYKVEADPEAWRIVDGKLYLLAFKERLPLLQLDPAAIVDKADANWPRLRDVPN